MKQVKQTVSSFLAICMIFGLFIITDQTSYLAAETALQNTSYMSSETFKQGDSISITCSAKGSTGFYQYAAYYKKTTDTKWTTLQSYCANVNLTFKPKEAVDYNICVKVKDNNGAESKKYFVLKVGNSLANNSVLNATSVKLGEQIIATGSATGGTGSYQYQVLYKRTSQTKWTVAQNYNENATVKFKPAAAVTYDVCVKVKDSNGTEVKKFFTVEVTNALQNTSKVSVQNIKLGETVTVTASATGGTGKYTYAIYYKKDYDQKWTTKQDYKTNNTVSVKPAKQALYNICVKVKDSDGTIAKKYFNITVSDVLQNTSTISTDTIKLGETVNVSCSAKGSSGFYQYAVYYKKETESKWTTKQNYSSNVSVSIKPANAAKYNVCVKVKDDKGTVDKKYFVISVTNDVTIPEVEKYTITYNIVGNDNYLKKLEISNPNRTTYTKNDSFSFQPITIEGYDWAGWFDASGEKVTKIQKGTTGDMTLWAKFEKHPYTVTFDSPLVPYNDTNTLTRYVSDTTPLRDLEWMGYVFMGWSDDNGNIIKEIKPGTTDIKVHANWTSNRNQTIPNDYLNKEYVAIDNSKNGQYIFVFDVGTIVNVPLYTIRNFGNAVGMKVEESYTKSITIGEEQSKSVNETVANATTRSTSWTLSKDWNELVTEVKGQDRTITDESTISISNGSSQAYTQSYDESIGTSDGIATKNGISAKKIKSSSATLSGEMSQSVTEYDIFEGGGVSLGLGAFEVGEASFGLNINGKWGYEATTSATIGGSISNSQSTEEEFFREIDTENNRSWNASIGTSQSASISQDKTVSNAVAESVSDKFEYSISKSTGGSESASTSDTTTNTEEKGFSSTFAYNTEQNTIEVSKWSNDGAPAGWYRLVCAGKVHVFAVVCYDIASSNYCTYTYSILDDDVYDFYDYSKNDKDFKDYNNGVLPFEVPVSVNEYVTKAISRTKGLTVERSTGMIDSYNGEAKNVWIPDNFVIDNDDGTYDIIQVKGIKANVFQGNSNINSVRLSSYITNISDNAFKNCTSLKHIYSNNLENIGNSAFANCSSLVDVEHDNLKSIGNNAFAGCTQLADFNISSKVQSVGNTAFNGINKVTAEANNANVVSSIAKCGAKSVTIDLGKMSDELRNVTITTNITDNFTLNGKGKTLYNVSIESSAKTTTLSRITFTDNQKTPLRINSQNVNLNQVNITNSTGMTMILESENTNIYLRGINTFTTTSKNAVLCKNISVALIPGTNETTKLSVPQGDILVCGDSVYSSLLNASIRTISQSDFENMISSHMVYFNANGGSVPTQSKSVAYNSTYGTLPTPTRDYHWFDGWFTAQNGGVKVNSDDIFTGDGDITLYAHWTQKDISNWVLESNVPSGAMIKDTKWTYDLTTTTTSSNSYLYGYTLYNTTWYWSDYGAWSGWQNEAVYGSESREVSTRYIEPTYKTQYNYNRWKSNSGHNWGPCQGTWSGVYCPNYEERGWTDEPLPFVVTRYSGQVGGNYNTYGDDGANAWYNEWTRQVQTGGGYTQYTYRDRYKIYTYYFRKVESKESSTEVRASDSISNVNKWVRYIEK